MKSRRLSFNKGNKVSFVTVYDFNYKAFFIYLKNNIEISIQFDKNMKKDFKLQENIEPPKSIIEMWKNNKRMKKNNTRFCILIHKKKYVGSFRYYKYIRSKESFTKLSIVYITQKYRRLGLAYKMLINLMKKNKKYTLNVDINNNNAIKLYNKLGFIKNSKLSDTDICVLDYVL